MTISFEDRDAADLKLQLTREEQARDAQRRLKERQRHHDAMQRIRMISMCPPPAPSTHWLARLGRWITRKL